MKNLTRLLKTIGKGTSESLKKNILQKIKTWNSTFPPNLAITPAPSVISTPDGHIVGTIAIPEESKAMKELYARRWKNYAYSDTPLTKRSTTDLRYVTGDKDFTQELSKIGENPTIAYIPPEGSNWGGFYDPKTKKSYISVSKTDGLPPKQVITHEGIMHPTDEIVRKLYTPYGYGLIEPRRVLLEGRLPKEASDTMYGSLTYPVDIYGDSALRLEYLHHYAKDGIFPTEGRATIGELTQLLYTNLAKLKGVSVAEAIRTIPESEFNAYVDSLSNKDIVNLLYHDSNGYGRLYVNYMRRGNKEQNTRYINRIKKILKIGGMYILGGLGLEHLYYNYDN